MSYKLLSLFKVFACCALLTLAFTSGAHFAPARSGIELVCAGFALISFITTLVLPISVFDELNK